MKKFLSIILAILMIVTTIPIAFAEEIHICSDKNFDEACDGCGKEIKVKIITSENNILYIDGVASDGNFSTGSYRLGGNVITDSTIEIIKNADVAIDLAGYQLTFFDYADFYLRSDLSIYDFSEEQTGKVLSDYEIVYISNANTPTFSLYGGTLETSYRSAIGSMYGNSYLYGGKIKSNGYAVSYYTTRPLTIKLFDVIIECGEGYSQFEALNSNAVLKAVIDVSGYTGEGLSVDYVNSNYYVGKHTVFTGIKNAEDAEKYTINHKKLADVKDAVIEKTEYDEATGEKSFFVVPNAFTQQPSPDNNYEALFNNPNAHFQWYEVEDKVTEIFTVDSDTELMEFDVKAGDILIADLESSSEDIYLYYNSDYSYLYEAKKTIVHFFTEDETVSFSVTDVDDAPSIKLKLDIFSAVALDGETESVLNQVECGKLYRCNVYTSVYNNYFSDAVEGHNIVTVDENAPTCTEIGWDAYEYCTVCDYSTYVEIPENGHTDADGDYICDNGCGHEFEKPVTPEEPTPDTPDEPTDEEDICADCGKVHTNFFSEIICLFTRIINFIKNLFA